MRMTTPTTLGQVGSALIDNGYCVVRCAAGTKRPITRGWTTCYATKQDVVAHSSDAVGVACGVGATPLCGLDIDCDIVDLTEKLIVLCHEVLGPAPVRRGRAARALLVYKYDTPQPKIVLKWRAADGTQPKIEALGGGQQFVAYGVHPDTGRPYSWDATDLVSTKANDLTLVTSEQITDLFERCSALASGYGLSIYADGLRPGLHASATALDRYVEPVGLTLDRARELLNYADYDDYGEWVTAGAALDHEFGGDAQAMLLWDEWSANSSNYAGLEAIEYKWSTFGSQSGAPKTMRWLLQREAEAAKEQKVTANKANREACRTAIANAASADDLLRDVLYEVATYCADNDTFTGEMAGLIAAKHKAITTVSMPQSEARSRLRAAVREVAKQEDVAPVHVPSFTEFDVSTYAADGLSGRHIYVDDLSDWHSWDGVRWVPRSEGDMQHDLRGLISKLALYADKIQDASIRGEFLSRCEHYETATAVGNITRLLRSDKVMRIKSDRLDTAEHMLNATNGMLDMRAAEFLGPRPDLYPTKTLGCDYDPAADCPLWRSTVSDIFSGDADLIDFIQRFVGYAALGGRREDIMLIAFGDGANGKSTLFNTVADVLGDYAVEMSIATMMHNATDGGGARPDLIKLKGSLFVRVSEPPAGMVLRDEVVKSLSGSDPVTARQMYSPDRLTFPASWAMVMPTNHRPAILNDDLGIWRRLVFVPFERDFTADLNVTQDIDRPRKLAAERSGILNWILGGAQRYVADGRLHIPPKLLEMREAFRLEANPVAAWLAECCDTSSSELWASNADLWRSWRGYAEANGYSDYCRTAVALGKILDRKHKSKVVKVDGGSVRGRCGIAIKAVDF